MKKFVFAMPLMVISLLASCGGSKPEPETIYHYVTFVTNGGSTIEQAKVEDNKTLKKPTDPTKSGYAFDMWCTDEGLTNEYDFSHLVTEDFTLYAKWNTAYTITYHNVNDSEHSNPKQYTEKDEITLSRANKDYYNFIGWFTDSTFKNPITKIEKGTKGNLDIYAEFEAIEYTITYDYDGGTGATNPSSYTIETPTVTLPTPTTMKTGYDGFDGWYFDKAHTQSAGTGWSAGTQHGNKNLYAKYKNPTTYTISYPNVTDTEHSDPKQYTIETPTITLSKASRANYNFIGWFTDEACSKGNEITEIKKGSTGNLVIYAKFVPIKYEIEYVLNGGTSKGDNPDIYTVEDKITLNPATHQTLVFGGWCLKQDLTDNPITGWNPGDKTGKVTLYAKWVSEYTITYKNVTSEETSGFTAKYTSKDLPLTLPKPTRDDWSFNGYYTDKTFNENSKLSGTDKNIIPVGTTGNLTLYTKMVYKTTVLENCSWEEIKMISEKEGARATFGEIDGTQTKKVQLKHQSGNVYQTVRIIGYDCDKDANGNSLGITFEFADYISDKKGLSISTLWNDVTSSTKSSADYLSSTIRANLTGQGGGSTGWYEKEADEKSGEYTQSVLSMLPDGLAGVLKDTSKEVNTMPSSTWTKTTFTDKLFLLAPLEMGYENSYAEKGLTTYPYYEGHDEYQDIIRMKRQVDKTTYQQSSYFIHDAKYSSFGVESYAGLNYDETDGGMGWLRSPYTTPSGTCYGWMCGVEGDLGYGTKLVCSAACAVAPAFCI